MKFFKPEDFKNLYSSKSDSVKWEDLAEFANNKLEEIAITIEHVFDNNCHKFYATEPGIYIIKGKCEHPKEKLNLKDRVMFHDNYGAINIFECDCGVKLIPTEFKEIP